MNCKSLILSVIVCLMPVCAHAELSFLNATKEQRAFFKKDLELQVQEIESQLYSEFGEGVLEFLDHLAYDLKVVLKVVGLLGIPAAIMYVGSGDSHFDFEDAKLALQLSAGLWLCSLGMSVKEGKLEKQKELKEKLKQIKASLREISVLDSAEEQTAVAYNK